jgi:hypothetical protein
LHTAGNSLGDEVLFVGPFARMAFSLADKFSETAGVAGVAEFSSTVPLGALGLQFNSLGSFTSITPFAK